MMPSTLCELSYFSKNIYEVLVISTKIMEELFLSEFLIWAEIIIYMRLYPHLFYQNVSSTEYSAFRHILYLIYGVLVSLSKYNLIKSNE